MTHREICALHILEALDQQTGITQRDLAGKIGVSLGLVNAVIKAMGAKGYFKAEPMGGNRLFYRLTATGLEEKRRLTRLFIHFGYRSFRRARRRLTAMFQELAAEGLCRVVFFGGGDFAEMAYLALRSTGLTVVALVDDSRIGQTTALGAVASSEQLPDMEFDRIVVTDFETGQDRYQRLIDLGMAKERIVSFFDGHTGITHR